MAKLPGGFSSKGKETMSDRSVVDAGDYIAEIVKSEYLITKAKDGHRLNLHWKILDGPFKGRMVFSNLNLDNPDEQAQDIAEKELNTIVQACGKVSIKEDSEEIHNIPVKIKVTVRPANSNFAAQNEIKFYSEAKGFKKPTSPGSEESGEGTEKKKSSSKVVFDD